MTDEINETDTSQPAFRKIRYYLDGGPEKRKVTIGVLATAIENEGIYTWDCYGRFDIADEDAKERMLYLLAQVYTHENDWLIPPNPKDHPIDFLTNMPDDMCSFFGWPENEIPDFENIAKEHVKTARARPDTPQARAAFTKKQNTYLKIIAALFNNQGIDLGDKGNVTKIQRIIEISGLSLHKETIRTVLNEVREAVEREK